MKFNHYRQFGQRALTILRRIGLLIRCDQNRRIEHIEHADLAESLGVDSAWGHKTPPPFKCTRFLHFVNLKHRNLSRLILRQSGTPHPADLDLVQCRSSPTPCDCITHWATDHRHQRLFSREKLPLKKWIHSRRQVRCRARDLRALT